MSITNIISAIGNNSSIYPLLVRDCGIENPAKVVLTYNQNKKESKKVAKLATRERFIDEYAVSAVWLGGIPLIEKISDYVIKKQGYNPNINLKLFGKDKFQNIESNIKIFKGKVPDSIIKELELVKNNKSTYEKILATKFIAATTIPILFMGIILPKLIFASSAKKIDKQIQNKQLENINTEANKKQSIQFLNKKKISFKSNLISAAANLSTVNKMAITDGGYSLGRIGTARNKNESLDVGFKMAGMMFLNYIAPKWIESGLNKLISKTTGLNVDLDPTILNDTKFINAIKEKNLKLPKNNSTEEILQFIDNNANSLFVKYAEKLGKIKMLKVGESKIRDPRSYINIKDLINFKKNIELFEKGAISSKNILQYAKKAKIVKSVNIITNIVTSSILLAYVLPKAQFAFRKLVTGSDLEPGLAQAKNKI